MRLEPYRMVTLLELLELNAEAFCRLSSIVGQLIILLRHNADVDASEMVRSLGELQREASRLGFRSVDRQLERIKERVTGSDGIHAAQLEPMIMDLYTRLREECEDGVFLVIPPEMKVHYKQSEPLFGADVEKAFGSEAAEDISEAGKCYALGRYTASVFHLMRAMEKAVQMLADKLGATVQNKHGEFLTWGVMISNMSDKVKLITGESAKTWSETLTLLYHVKEAWRSETMHPKRTYTQEQAKEVFDASRAFMRRLAAMV